MQIVLITPLLHNIFLYMYGYAAETTVGNIVAITLKIALQSTYSRWIDDIGIYD